MSELKEIGIRWEENGELHFSHVYLKSDVDEAIAELKAKLESVQASAYADSVDAGMRERRLKRALWLTRAERAKDIQTNQVFLKRYLRKHKNSWLARYKELTWDLFKEAFEIVERKCRAKAEEYK